MKDRVYACHVKNFVVRPNVPLRRMDGNWRNRAMQFTDLGSGDLNMVRYVEMLINIGYPNRYNKIMGTETAPLIAETESNYRDPDATAIEGIQYVRDQLCFPFPKAPSRTKWARKKPANEFSGHGQPWPFFIRERPLVHPKPAARLPEAWPDPHRGRNSGSGA